MASDIERIGIVGGGAWGTAAGAGRAPRRPARDAVGARGRGRGRNQRASTATRRSCLALRSIPQSKPSRLGIAGAMRRGADGDAGAGGARHRRSNWRQVLPHETPIIVCAKGIESQKRPADERSGGAGFARPHLAMLSGPTFAEEVARGLPTAITLACSDATRGQELAQALATPTFRPYWSDDVTGTALGGAVKNVLAIACGIVEGRELGSNARAALLTRGFAEMMRLGLALGAQRETLAGLAGLGDLTLTCSSSAKPQHEFRRCLGQRRQGRRVAGGKAASGRRRLHRGGRCRSRTFFGRRDADLRGGRCGGESWCRNRCYDRNIAGAAFARRA